MENILGYFERTVERYPDWPAVFDGKIELSWKQLKDLSLKAAAAVRRQTGPGNPVVVLAEKSSETLACMLGVLYAGCFYVMIDPMQPAGRIRNILSVLNTNVVIAAEGTENLLEKSGYGGKVLRMKDAFSMDSDMEKIEDMRSKWDRKQLLYILFTSGSTGVPKGVAVSHGAVIDFICHFTEIFRITEHDSLGNQAPFDFDVSVKDIYSCIMTGARLVIIPSKMFAVPGKLLDYICGQKVTVLIWAVSALTMISSLRGLKYKVPVDVRMVMFSGEVMPVRQLLLWQAALPDTEFINLYGPTEITCNCTYYPVRRIFSENEKLPIGRPFPGRNVFLLGEHGEMIFESGKSGEICVAGESLAEGYYHNKEATEKAFFHEGTSQTRCYHTGDLGYRDAEGLLYFAGRRDFQFKHMGHRIEPEEIERAVEMTDNVEKCCCVVDRGKNRLVVFYLGDAEPEEIRRTLKNSVPAYMIPHRFLRTEQMPLNKNGKTDRQYFIRQLEAGK